MDLSMSTRTLEAFLLVVVRSGGFVAVAPLFGHKSVNARLRVLIAICISLTIFSATDITLPEYSTVFGYSLLVVKEVVVGLSLGFAASITMSILKVAGEFIDREIGFTMATNFDMSAGGMITVTSELYDRMVYAVILITNMHYYILKALAQSFELVPIGRVNVNYLSLYSGVLGFMGQYFSIGFRIAMPIFIGATVLNIILGVLAKSSPQLNMFSIGMQLKVLAGLAVLSIAVMFIPNIATYLMERMQDILSSIMGAL